MKRPVSLIKSLESGIHRLKDSLIHDQTEPTFELAKTHGTDRYLRRK